MPIRDTWEFVNSFAPWLAAFGTILAATVALFLARRDVRLNLRAVVTFEAENTLGKALEEDYDRKSYLTVRVVNLGPREATIVSVLWSGGWICHWIGELVRHDDSSSVPIRLRDGDEVHFRYDQDLFFREFIQRMPRMPLGHHNRIRPAIEKLLHKSLPWSSLRAVIFTSTGKRFFARISRRILKDYPLWLRDAEEVKSFDN